MAPQFTGTGSSQSYQVMGLHSKIDYYVRAYLDINGNEQLDAWEPQGIARDKDYESPNPNYEYWVNYDIGVFRPTAGAPLSGVKIVLRGPDGDLDNVPDAWEQFYFGTDGNVATYDGNGVGLTMQEEYAWEINPNVADTDGDGLSDALEIGTLGTSPTNAAGDLDADGVPEAIEILWDGSGGYDPFNPITNPTGTDMDANSLDTDGDGVGDLMEIAAGSDPISASSSNQISIGSVGVTNGNPVVSWDIFSNINSVDVDYDVQATTDFITWVTVGTVTADGDTTAPVSFVDTISTAPAVFYRLELSIP